MEEILRSVYEYSDELLLELLQEEQTLEAAVNILCGVIRSITAQEILREKEQLLLLYRYLLMLVRMPEMFDFEGRSISRTVEIFYGACMHHKLPLHTTLSGNEIGEEILTVLLHGVYRKMDHPSEPGRYANYSSPSRIEENSSYNLSVHEDLLKHPMATRILEKKSLWGLEPILPTGEDEWVHMQCRNSRIFNLTQSYILNLCPVYYTGEHIGIYMMYPEFYNKTKAEIQRARASLQKVVDQTNTRFFSIFKSLIMFNKDIKKNFISSIYSIYENNKEREKTRYKLEEVQPDAKIFTISNLLGRLIQPVANDTIKMQSIPADTLQRSEYLKSTQFPIATSTPCMTNSMSNMNSPSDISSRADAPKGNDTFLSELFYGKLLYNRISYTQIYTNYNAYTEDMRRTERAIASAPNDQRMKYVLSILNSELEYINALLACDTMRTEVVFLMYTVSFLNHMAHKGRLSTVPVFILENIIISLERLTHMKLGIRLTQEDVKKVHILCIHVLNSRININYKQEVIKLLLTYINTSECEYTPGIVLSIIMYFIDVQIEIRNQSEQLQERGRASCILDYLLENYKGKEEIRGILETAHSTSDHKDTKTVFLLHLLSSLVDAQERGFEELRKVSRAQRESEPAESIDTYIEHSNSYFYIVDVIDRIIFTLMDVSGKAFSSSLIMCRLASLLNASLITLVSKKSSELKLNSSKSTFSPVKLLGNRVKMYISLKTMAFVKAVAEDEDMFKPELFSKAIEICDRKGVLTQRDKAYAILFIKRVANLKEQRTVSSITYPDEFIDPLTFGLMKDPVILRTSNTRVDRSTAAMILMTDPTDPFTRDPLTEEDILEDHEMHKTIHDFLAKHT